MVVYLSMLFAPSLPSQDMAAAVRWATAKVVRAEGPPPLGDDGAMGWIAVDAVDAAESVIAKYGRTPEALKLLGRACLCQGRYGDAASAFQAAKDFEGAKRASDLDATARQFANDHPGRQVVHIKLLNGALAILHARHYEDSLLGGMGQASWRDLKLTVTGTQPRTFGPLKRLDFDFSEVSEAQLYAIDMDGDGSKEAVVMGVFYGASWTPTFTTVIGKTPRGWAQTRAIDCHDPMWIQDLDKDGKWEFGGVNVIGMTLSHAEQPRWLEIYRYRSGQAIPADADFPNYYRGYVKEIDTLLKEHPEDTHLLAYRGRTARLLGKQTDAKKFEQRALKHLAPKDGLTASWVKNTIWRPFDPTKR